MWQVIAVTWLQDSDVGSKVGDYQLVKYRNLAAIITRTGYKNIDRLTALEKVDAYFNYQTLLERAGINRTIIPVRFGTVLRTKKQINTLLMEHSKMFHTLLDYAKDKTEFDLMGIWKKEVGHIDRNIFEDIERMGFEVKPHKPGNRAICFHLSILMSQKEQKTFAILKEDLNKRLGDQIDVRVSEPLPPFNFFTIDLKESMGLMRKPNQKTIEND